VYVSLAMSDLLVPSVFGELIERISRTKQFLKKAKHSTIPENVNLVDELINKVKRIENRNEIEIYLVGEDADDRLSDLTAFDDLYLRLKALAENFLGRVRGEWTSRETHFLIEGLFGNFTQQIEKFPPIVLIPEYNFIYQNVYGLEAERTYSQRGIILGLTMIGFQAPDLWASLAHEAGHAIERVYDVTEKIKRDKVEDC